jgi:hypothetical protein
VTGGTGGMSGAGGGAGTGGGTGGTGGIANPTAGAGGVASGGTGGFNAGGAGGASGMAGGLGGTGGEGGAGGMGGTMSGGDAGMDPSAPVEACELERDLVMIEPQEGQTSCQITLPADVAYGPDQITLAITDAQGTTLVPQVSTTIACPEVGVAFAYSPAFIGAAVLELCEATCALAEGAIVEVIYGCMPPSTDL